MKRIVPLIALGVVSVGFQLSVAHEDHSQRLSDAKDPIAVRTYLMENIGDNAKEMKAKIDAGQITDAKVNAQAIALHASRIPDLFPQGSMSNASRAKEEIWQQWEAFLAAAKTLRHEADELGVVTVEGQAEKANTQLNKVFGACKSCHDSFRKPEEQV